MRAIIVDDEPLAIKALEIQLLKVGGVDIIGTYIHSELAVENALKLKPDVIFMDIDMPVISGIEAAEKLHSCLPQLDIVFVTAYDAYAVKAFELNAIDYLLKPSNVDRLRLTVERLKKNYDCKMSKLADVPAPLLRCFQSLQFDAAGHPEFMSWRTAKAQELFAYLVHRNHQPVRKDTLLELLWPESDQKKGLTQLYTAIYQIRKTLQTMGSSIEVQSLDKGYTLDLKNVRLDVEEWENGLRELPALEPGTLSKHKQLLDLYRGDYFADYDYIWAESERERLRALWFQHAASVADFMAASGMYAEALSLCYRIQQAFPYAEESYWALMKLYHAQGDYASVQRQYASLCVILNEEFGTKPNSVIEDWYLQYVIHS
ncbi:response regulator [Paenibacillus sedimenti]|uniref:Response regulator n=1 Tax=Paenibacillus sedimenti TaxID=2770274 RepID=A0A926KQ71_9BACL|nr:response regulator [Paenibacillus sedimenti]MBD0382024.1 response regulator [Paenibacillus sedimenti]